MGKDSAASSVEQAFILGAMSEEENPDNVRVVTCCRGDIRWQGFVRQKQPAGGGAPLATGQNFASEVRAGVGDAVANNGHAGGIELFGVCPSVV